MLHEEGGAGYGTTGELIKVSAVAAPEQDVDHTKGSKGTSMRRGVTLTHGDVPW
jgi:hypothetical protein